MTSPAASRFAALADIHGNVDALRAVLADIDTQGIETLVNLGDHFSGPLAAGETAQVLADRPMVSLRGNHDRWLCERAPAEMGPSDAAAYAELRVEDLDWLRTLPPHDFVADDVFACHATPTDDLTYWLETVSGDGVVGPRSLHEVAAFARGVPASVFLCAHTHIPRRVDLPDGRVILNPGSVGCPAFDDDAPVYHVVQTGTAAATYAILERTEAGWRSTFRNVPYDPTRMAARAREAGRPGWANAVSTGWLFPPADAPSADAGSSTSGISRSLEIEGAKGLESGTM